MTKEQALLKLSQEKVRNEIREYQFELRGKIENISEANNTIQELDSIAENINHMSMIELRSILNGKFNQSLNKISEQDIKDEIFNSNQKLFSYHRLPRTVNQLLENAFNYIKTNQEYLADDKNKPIRFKTDDKVFSIMSDKHTFIEHYDVLYDESDYHGFSVEEVLSNIPFREKSA